MKMTLLAAVLGTLTLGCASLAQAATETTPQNMTCKEFVNLNPKAMTPVAFWMLNKDTDYKGGDYADWNEVETVAVPQVMEVCKQHPQKKVMDIKGQIKPAGNAAH